jgi:hypothetical protein
MISFFTAGVKAISGLPLVTATTATGLIHGHSL